MTKKRVKPFWHRDVESYLQQDVVEPPIASNPHNARHAIWHLGENPSEQSPIYVELFPIAAGWRSGDEDPIDDGRSDRGQSLILPVYAVTHPGSSGDDNTISAIEGERREGLRTFYIDSNQEENKNVAKQNPTIFPSGSFDITGADNNGMGLKLFKHAAIFHYNGERWEAHSIKFWNNARNKALDFAGGVYEVKANLRRDTTHERDATPETPGFENDTYDQWKIS